jgi:hypothetical protein
MKRVLVLAAWVFVTMLWLVPVNVEAQDQAGQVQQPGQVVDKRVVPPYMSVRDKVMVQRETQERAAASRNALKRQAWMEQQAQQKNADEATQQKMK